MLNSTFWTTFGCCLAPWKKDVHWPGFFLVLSEVSSDATLWSCHSGCHFLRPKICDSCILWRPTSSSSCYSCHPKPRRHTDTRTQHLTHSIPNTSSDHIFPTHTPSGEWVKTQAFRSPSLLFLFPFPVSGPFYLRHLCMHIIKRAGRCNRDMRVLLMKQTSVLCI